MIDKVLKSADVGSVNLPFPGYTQAWRPRVIEPS
jgi:hypothetical protein